MGAERLDRPGVVIQVENGGVLRPVALQPPAGCIARIGQGRVPIDFGIMLAVAEILNLVSHARESKTGPSTAPMFPAAAVCFTFVTRSACSKDSLQRAGEVCDRGIVQIRYLLHFHDNSNPVHRYL